MPILVAVTIATHHLVGALFGGLVELLEGHHPAILFRLILCQDQHLTAYTGTDFRRLHLVAGDLENGWSDDMMSSLIMSSVII